MNKKNTYALIAVFLILIIGFSVQKVLQHNKQQKLKEGRKIVNLPSDTEVNSISILKPENQTINLKKIGGRWFVAMEKNYPAEEELVYSVISAFQQASIMSVASMDKNDMAEYGLDENQRTEFILKNNDQIIDRIYIGNKAERPGGYYYIYKKSPEAILLAQNLNDAVQYTEWRTSIIHRIDKEEISKVKINLENDSFEIIKKDDGWYLDDKLTNATTTEILINNLSVVQAVKFPKPEDEFMSGPISLEIETASDVKKIEFGQNLESGWIYVQNSEGLVYIINESTKNNIINDRNNLLAK